MIEEGAFWCLPCDRIIPWGACNRAHLWPSTEWIGCPYCGRLFESWTRNEPGLTPAWLVWERRQSTAVAS